MDIDGRFQTVRSIFNLGGRFIESKDLQNSNITIIREDGSHSQSGISGYDYHSAGGNDILTIYTYVEVKVTWCPEMNVWLENSRRGAKKKVRVLFIFNDYDEDEGIYSDRDVLFPIT